jgi:hypothetical protein
MDEDGGLELANCLALEALLSQLRHWERHLYLPRGAGRNLLITFSSLQLVQTLLSSSIEDRDLSSLDYLLARV